MINRANYTTLHLEFRDGRKEEKQIQSKSSMIKLSGGTLKIAAIPTFLHFPANVIGSRADNK